MAGTVIGALRRFLPSYLDEKPPLSKAQRRAVWAITHCRTAEMGGHLHACACGTREFAFHSCNHRACPQCGKSATAEWVRRELSKRVGAPYFMVTFTLPEELRSLFFTAVSEEVYRIFFAAAASALKETLAHPHWLGAQTCGFTMVLHTWNQRLHFHPHLHTIVPGAGIAPDGRVVTVPKANYLVRQETLRAIFRARFREKLAALNLHLQQLDKLHTPLPDIDPAVWEKDWGVHLQPFGSGERVIQYLGAYVCRTAIGDARILAVTETHVTFRWKDRAHQNAVRTESLPGREFVRRYLRHVLPRGMRAIRYYGFCHPAAKANRERVALHTGRPLFIGAAEGAAQATTNPEPAPPRICPCCGGAMTIIAKFHPLWRPGRAPPIPNQRLRNA